MVIMSGVEQLLKDFYIIIHPLPKTRNEFSISQYAFLETCLRVDETWDLFLQNHFNSIELNKAFGTLTENEREGIFKFGIACLIQFVKCNFTGPALEKETEDYLNHEKFSKLKFGDYLNQESKQFDVNVKYPILLHTSNFIFELCIVNTFINKWWHFRSLLIQQHITEVLCPYLLKKVQIMCKYFYQIPLKGYVKAYLNIEMAQACLLFRMITQANRHITSAAEELDIHYEYTGVLGKRTKYQERDLPQLSLKVNLTEDSARREPETETTDVPTTIQLEDDVLRTGLIFIEQKQDHVVLTNLEQKFILTLLVDRLVSKPQDELHVEELQPLICVLLPQKSTYSIRAATLLLRSKIDGKNKRRILRSMVQCKEIVNSWERETPHYLARVVDVFGTGMPPMWRVQAQYAELSLNCGMVNEALEVYSNIKLWEEIVVCYTILNNKHKAIEILKEEYDKKPTAKLMCLLGDATDDPSWYDRALEVTNNLDPFVLRHVGNYYYKREEYEKCISFLDSAVKVNSLNIECWFRLGYAAMQTENWTKVVTAFLRYTTLEPDCFAAWNNLAQGHLKVGNRKGAHAALHNSIKCNFENWRVWENLLIVSCDLEIFSDVIIAYNRLLQLNGKYLNLGVLDKLVMHVSKTDNVSTTLLQDTRNLFEKVIAECPNEGFLWELNAKLTPDPYLQAASLQKAYKGFTKGEWNKNPSSCQQVLNICNQLADIVLKEDIDRKHSIVNDTRLLLNSAISAVTRQKLEETEDLLITVSNNLKRIYDDKLGK